MIGPMHPGVTLREEFMEPYRLGASHLSKVPGIPRNRIGGIEHGIRARRLRLVVVQRIPKKDTGIDGDQGAEPFTASRRDSSSLMAGSPETWRSIPLATPALCRTMVMQPSATKLRYSSPGPIPASLH